MRNCVDVVPKFIISILIFYALSLAGSIFDFNLKDIISHYGIIGGIVAISIPIVVIGFYTFKYTKCIKRDNNIK